MKGKIISIKWVVVEVQFEKEIPNGEKGQYTNPIAAFDRKPFYIPDIK